MDDPGGEEHEGRNENPNTIVFLATEYTYSEHPKVGVDTTEINIPGVISTASVDHDSEEKVHESNKTVAETVREVVDCTLIFERLRHAVGVTGFMMKMSSAIGGLIPEETTVVHEE